MSYLQKINKVFFLILCSYSFILSISVAEALSLKIDGYNQTVLAQNKSDPETGHLVIEASYGNVDPVMVPITDPSVTHSYNPIMAVSRDSTAVTSTAVVWISYMLSSSDFAIELAILSIGETNTWSAPVSFHDVNETPADDYQVDISGDGTTISVAWTTYLISENQTKIRLEQSIDNGANWTTTYFDVF